MLKMEKFVRLKQGSMFVNEYYEKFIQLLHYSPTKVELDEKQYLFLKGLIDPLQYHLMNHTFANF